DYLALSLGLWPWEFSIRAPFFSRLHPLSPDSSVSSLLLCVAGGFCCFFVCFPSPARVFILVFVFLKTYLPLRPRELEPAYSPHFSCPNWLSVDKSDHSLGPMPSESSSSSPCFVTPHEYHRAPGFDDIAYPECLWLYRHVSVTQRCCRFNILDCSAVLTFSSLPPLK
ncbi:uncharacterized protein EV420DRAFT_202979, partial [Desarmillaria tabescens]